MCIYIYNIISCGPVVWPVPGMPRSNSAPLRHGVVFSAPPKPERSVTKTTYSGTGQTWDTWIYYTYTRAWCVCVSCVVLCFVCVCRVYNIHIDFFCIMYGAIYIYIHMSSRQNPLHLSSCFCYGYRFWGGQSLSRVLWKSACSRSFRACIFLSLCINFLSCSSHFPFMFLSYSFHFHSNVHSCPLIFLSFARFAFMSFHFLSKVMEMALWLGQGTECNKWLSLSYH